MKMTTISKEEFICLCEKCFKINGLEQFCEQNTLNLLYQMVDHMLEINAVMNLTAITEPKDIILKHLADSLTVARFLPEHAHVLDVGCGGGFPSLPLAIARPDLEITALDSTAKKTAYVSDSAKLLSLGNLKTLTGRAEELAQSPEYRESFDFTVARAVASLPVLSELCLPFVKIGGKMVAMKAKLDESESTNAHEMLGSLPFERHEFELKDELLTESRLILVAKKQKHTPKEYPRAYAQIKKKPL
ncbi:MAG: 16S rRNA (guanine(527)-N(7))-methyltransferase RsmG [Clostridia bacterium]|nr:16S rRNA (guanine(527)-N(7))-methyltransferase RsmG [Clostridia bacterium]